MRRPPYGFKSLAGPGSSDKGLSTFLICSDQRVVRLFALRALPFCLHGDAEPPEKEADFVGCVLNLLAGGRSAGVSGGGVIVQQDWVV